MRLLAFLGLVLLPGAALAQEMELRLVLMGPLGTKISHKGDRIFARVAQPQALKDDMVQGTVTEVRSGGKLHGNSVLNFSFESIEHCGQPVPISTQIKGFLNSKGQADVDEEGRVIRRGGGNLGKAAAATGAGGLIGGLAGGLKGAAIGAGVGAAASIAVIEIAADSPEIRFDAGSIVTVSAKGRGGPELTSLTANSGGAAPAGNTAMAAPAAAPNYPTTAAPAPSAAPVAPAAGGVAQPDFTALKADFIPGEKILLYDDFSDMAGDEPPPHWRVRGTTAELRVAGEIRQMTVKGRVTLTPNLKDLPQNFTMETDVAMEGTGERPELNWVFLKKDGGAALEIRTKQEAGNTWWMRMDAGQDPLGEATVPADWKRPVKLALWAQNGRLRLYVNGRRVFDVNQVTLPAIATVENRMDTGAKPVGYQFVRFAESTPDFSRSIMSSGRYVTHGILFDTNSDHLRPESAAIIKSIGSGLQTSPDLRLMIEGHTDATGQAAANLDLSKRRAEAVKQVLVSQFQIDPGRLTTDGLGASKPIDTNDTPQGRSQNRRVEFVRQP